MYIFIIIYIFGGVGDCKVENQHILLLKFLFYYSKTLMPYMYFIRTCIFVKDKILIHKSLYLVDVKLSWDKTVIN